MPLHDTHHPPIHSLATLKKSIGAQPEVDTTPAVEVEVSEPSGPSDVYSVEAECQSDTLSVIETPCTWNLDNLILMREGIKPTMDNIALLG